MYKRSIRARRHTFIFLTVLSATIAFMAALPKTAAELISGGFVSGQISKRPSAKKDESLVRSDSKESGVVSAQAKGLWVFGGSVVPNPVSDSAGRGRLVTDSSASGVDRLFVSVYQSTVNSSGRRMYQDADMAALNSAAHAAGQEVWAAYGDIDWPGFACNSGAFPVQRMAEIAAYNATRSAAEKFDGVMLDVEPNITTEAQYQALISHYQCMRDSLPADVKLGVAIKAFWHGDVMYPSTGGTVKPAYQHIIDLNVDSVIVMGYRDTAGTDNCPTSDGLICLDRDEINYASSINKAGLVLVGLETIDVGVSDPPKVTFFQEGHVSLAVEARKAASYFASNPAFGGFAIHNYTSMYLNGTPAWPSPETAGACSLGATVEVESSGGTTIFGYPTLGAAFAAINAGTHTGTISIEICASTNEGTTPATLNSSGAVSASYTSIYINPVVDGVSITGNPGQGLGVVQLNSADNVTIDGDNPTSAGINRNLTIINSSLTAVTFGSVLRIANPATAGSSSDNNTFKNLVLNGNVTGGNSSLFTTAGSSSNSSFGIYVGGSGSMPPAEPTAITSFTSHRIPTGTTVNNLLVENNAISQAGRAIVFNGDAAAQSNGVTISKNLIGDPSAGSANGVYSMGVTVQGISSLRAIDNTLYVESYLNAGIRGIDIGSSSGNVSGVTIERNRVLRVRNNNILTRGAYGINLEGGNGHAVRNNFVTAITNDQTNGSAPAATTGGAFGIRLASGTAHRIYHNSVHLTGSVPGSIQTNVTAAFMIVGTSVANVDARNNIFSNQLTGGNPTGTRHAAIMLPSGANSTMNLTLNNNAYYQGTDAKNRLAQVGSTIGSGEYLAANFNPNESTIASNFRTYSNALSGDATNDNRSFATSAVPPFVSATDLHTPGGYSTQLESGGAAVGVTNDIDLAVRSSTAPDIGADEFLAPSAANVSLGGRVLTREGLGIRNATVTLEGGDLAAPRTAITGPFGYYTFGELRAGLTYVLTVRSKRHQFADPTRVINLVDEVADFDFTAEPQY